LTDLGSAFARDRSRSLEGVREARARRAGHAAAPASSREDSHQFVARCALLRGARGLAYIESTKTDLDLQAIPDDELLRRLGELVSQSRRVEADLVAHIGEVEERRLYARLAFPSMFAYCTDGLHLSEAEAYRRITVARAARQHGVLLAMLRDLSGIAVLAPLLRRDDRDTLLARATHRSKREIEKLVAEIAPRPDVPSVLRKLPQRRTTPEPDALRDPADGSSTSGEISPLLELVPGRVASLPRAAAPDSLLASSLAPSRQAPSASPAAVSVRLAPAAAAPPSLASVPLASLRATATMATTHRPAIVEPLSPARYKVQFTASAELRDKLQRLTALLRSQVPDGDLASVIDRAVSETLERLEARRYARAAAPRRTLANTDAAPSSRHVPAAVRRAVHERDGDRCGYVDDEGRRCSARDRLEFHHRHPFGIGGDHSPGNIALLCPTHNRFLAERDYGRETIRRHRRREADAPA
jgi:hypothetical protein